jgi:hypothetical protein
VRAGSGYRRAGVEGRSRPTDPCLARLGGDLDASHLSWTCGGAAGRHLSPASGSVSVNVFPAPGRLSAVRSLHYPAREVAAGRATEPDTLVRPRQALVHQYERPEDGRELLRGDPDRRRTNSASLRRPSIATTALAAGGVGARYVPKEEPPIGKPRAVDAEDVLRLGGRDVSQRRWKSAHRQGFGT